MNALLHSSRITRWLAYATVLVAFFLRAYRLADKNIWWDEGWSVWLSQKDLAWIALRTAADEHPPLHYWILHFWNMLAGTDAFAGRFLSLAFGVLTVALLYRIGKRVGGTRVGVLAAAFLAAARFHIWWSQDIKNYTPSIFFAFAAVWFALDSEWLMADGRLPNARHSPFAIRYSLLGYALCAALALWTHYLAALVLLALNLYALIIFIRALYVSRFTFQSAIRNLQSAILSWLIANLLAAVLFAPWMLLYLQNAATWSAAPPFDFSLFVKLVATVLPLGVTINIDNYAALTIALTTIAALGAVGVIASREAAKQSPNGTEIASSNPSTTSSLRSESAQGAPRNDILLFALIVLLPPILIYILSLTPVSFFAPKIQARYLLVLLPAYVLLLALGIALLSRFSRYLAAFAILFVFAANAFVLNDYYAERRLTDDYTTLANTINSFARQGDIVLLDTDQEWPTFLYYLRAPLEWLGVPNGKPMDAGAADALVHRALTRGSAVWLVAIPDALATDPQHLVEARLAREMPKQFEQTFDDKRVALYAPAPRDLSSVPRDAERFAPQFVRDLYVSDALQLLGFDLPVREARPGDIVRVVTYWRAQTQRDLLICPANFECDMTHIPAGDRVRAETDFVVPPGINADLSIRVGALELTRVHVQPRIEIAPAGAIAHPTDYRLGDSIHLVGYDLPETSFRAGASVPITLYWRADLPIAGTSIETSYIVFVHLLGAQFNAARGNRLWGQIDRVPRDGAYPTTAWLPNEIVPDAYRVSIDPDAPAGTYQIEIGLYDPATGARLPVDAGGDSIVVAEISVR